MQTTDLAGRLHFNKKGAAAQPAQTASGDGNQLRMNPSTFISALAILIAPLHSSSDAHHHNGNPNEITPLISGICSPPQRQKLFRH